jgi:pimeloyl-ACP methyl ester carboxylesterase
MTQENLTFANEQGHQLAARLDTPDERVPRGYILFGHCFTGSKDVLAAARIAKALWLRGFAVFRFDFTGLGDSEGDFADTTFSSNVDDLVTAATFLRDTRDAPSVMIGHSLGGAAVLAAAGKIPEARAVCTIGAPSDPEHVAHHFADHRSKIEDDGEANVTIGGRAFRIKKSFLDDIESHRLDKCIANLQKALLIFHSPIDSTVGIENARHIYEAARHPKSFVTLDGADHMLTNRADAYYVAEVISAWANRYDEVGSRSKKREP